MRIVDQVHHDAPSLGLDGYQEYSDPPAGAAPACEGPAGRNESPQPHSEFNTSRHPIATTMSWLVALFIEACAAYGEAIYPSLLVPAELNHDQEQQRNLQRHCEVQVEYRSELPWLKAPHLLKSEDSERSAEAQTPRSGLNARVSSVATRFWAKKRCERQVWLTIAKLEALDDRMLKDIGIHHSKIESTVRHGDRYEW